MLCVVCVEDVTFEAQECVLMKMMVMATMIAVSEGSIDYMGYQPKATLMTARTSGGWIYRREERGKGRRRSGLYVTSNNQIAINSSSSTEEGRDGREKLPNAGRYLLGSALVGGGWTRKQMGATRVPV